MIKFLAGDAHLAALEAAERNAWVDSYSVAEQTAGDALQVSHVLQAGAALTAMQAINFGLFNRAQGLGCDGPFSEADAVTAITWLREHCAPDWRFQLVPASLPVDFGSRASGLGLSPKGRGPAKLYRDASPVPASDSAHDTGLEVRRVTRDNAKACIGVAKTALGMPPAFDDWGSGLVGRENWHCYAAFDGGVPVAFGLMFVRGEWAWVGWGATLSQHRGRGAQSAILRHRIADGMALGVKHFATECAAPSEGDRAAWVSYRNVTRVGFSEAYIRVAYGPT